MALPWALAVLSLLPLLDARRLACTNYVVPITEPTLDRISGKWFLIAWAYRDPEYKESTRDLKAGFFHMTYNQTKDSLLLREYSTTGDRCIYTYSVLRIHRENGTVYKYDENGRKHFGRLILPKDRKIYMLVAFPDDPQKIGISFFALSPRVTRRQRKQFYNELKCRGIKRSEVKFTNTRKDFCKTLEKQHEEERKAKGETERDTVLDKDVGDVGGLS
ncbi:alpha-1-acid glycoprotein-like [Pteronotus mesoamericanus]|uniref:alpha-1-acid glycoprotein-like n=1 Tax=Pteronotus mesoamericanus TaxID=1884717 RepID=UPI0023ED6042|nr:alpha-1-acid glycoprotein-like [Pteronotus parnellii mesoamericanus]